MSRPTNSRARPARWRQDLAAAHALLLVWLSALPADDERPDGDEPQELAFMLQASMRVAAELAQAAHDGWSMAGGDGPGMLRLLLAVQCLRLVDRSLWRALDDATELPAVASLRLAVRHAACELQAVCAAVAGGAS